jgi:hypothetical protein
LHPTGCCRDDQAGGNRHKYSYGDQDCVGNCNTDQDNSPGDGYQDGHCDPDADGHQNAHANRGADAGGMAQCTANSGVRGA